MNDAKIQWFFKKGTALSIRFYFDRSDLPEPISIGGSNAPSKVDWEIIEKSHDFEKKDAFTVEFPLRLPADGTVKLIYRVRIRT